MKMVCDSPYSDWTDLLSRHEKQSMIGRRVVTTIHYYASNGNKGYPRISNFDNQTNIYKSFMQTPQSLLGWIQFIKDLLTGAKSCLTLGSGFRHCWVSVDVGMEADARLDVEFDMNLMFRERWKEGVYGNLLDSHDDRMDGRWYFDWMVRGKPSHKNIICLMFVTITIPIKQL